LKASQWILERIMMPRSSRAVFGICRLCGKQAKLTLEHVPPEKAFNDSQILAYTFGDYESKPRRIKGKQNGNKVQTLCEQCNNTTGHWYGTEYARWAHTLAEITRLRMKSSEHCTALLKQVYPLRFLKQAITCFFSVIDSPKAQFAKNNPQLVKFVQEKYGQELPTEHRFFLNLQQTNQIKSYPLMSRITVIYDDKGNITGHAPVIFSEFTHYPLSLLMTHQGMEFRGAYEITFFANYGYDEYVDMFLDLTLTRESEF
jgi:hypothetical protein